MHSQINNKLEFIIKCQIAHKSYEVSIFCVRCLVQVMASFVVVYAWFSLIFQEKGFLTGSNQIPQMNLKGRAFNFAPKEGGFFLLSRQVPPSGSWLLIQTLYIALTLLMIFQKCSHFECHVSSGIWEEFTQISPYYLFIQLIEKFQRPSYRYLLVLEN